MSETNSASPSPWNSMSVLYNTVGVFVGLALASLGLVRSYTLVDSIWFQWVGEIKVTVLSQRASSKTDIDEFYHTTFQIPKRGTRPSFKLRINDKKLYNYVHQRFSPASDLRLEASLVQRMLSRTPYLARVGPVRLGKTPKSAELIVYMGLLVIGGAVAFTALRDLRKRWLRRG